MGIYGEDYINLQNSFTSGINGADDSYREDSYMTTSKSLGNYCSGVEIFVRQEHYKLLIILLLAPLFKKLRISLSKSNSMCFNLQK